MTTFTSVSIDRPILSAEVNSSEIPPKFTITLEITGTRIDIDFSNIEDFKSFCEKHNVSIHIPYLSPSYVSTAPSGCWTHPSIAAALNDQTSISELVSFLSQNNLKAQKIYFKDTQPIPAIEKLVRANPTNWLPEQDREVTPTNFLVAQFIEFDDNDEDYAEPVAIFAVPADETKEGNP